MKDNNLKANGGQLNIAKNWDDLSLEEQSQIMRTAIQNGIYNLNDIKTKYNEFAGGGELEEWKALNNIDYEVVPDTSFTIDKTGTGTIEYFNSKYPQGITYPNGYHKAHPMPGKDVILYNPKYNDYQDIRLDALHIMPKDATYDALNSLYRDAAKDSDVAYNAKLRYDEDLNNYGKENIDSYQDYFNNEADGLLRNMFIEGTPEYITSRRYYPNKAQLKEWNSHLMPYINNIQSYLETGVRPSNVLPEVIIAPNKKALGGPLVEAANIYADGGNSSDRATGNNNLGFTIRNAIAIARNFGLNDRYKGSTNDTTYARNIFNMVDPTNAIPQDFSDVFNYVRIAEKANSGERYKYKREKENIYSDAAWAKRLGLPYDSTILIDNSDGSVRLSKQLEKEIPTDTTFLKNRIKENETNINNTYGPQRKTLRLALEYDKDALEALRETYKTGKPVILNEHSHTSRNWSGLKPENIDTTPLNLMHRFTVQYDKNKNKMNYWDKYDFDEYEDFVPGKPFLIKGSINLKK